MSSVLNKKELAELDALKFEFCDVLRDVVLNSADPVRISSRDDADVVIYTFSRVLELHHRIQNFQSIAIREREDRKNYLAGGR